MAGFLALLGHLIWGPEDMLQLLFFGLILALVNPGSSPDDRRVGRAAERGPIETSFATEEKNRHEP
ncbi:MAG: hypothetical protein USCGTAYLOR_01839 [Chromatiales bacterium USCg_Taylor]|nr:MAG: hypothetical protein USCGTAYLOR_01839 [Chromatiales bacterium USCg_Taylor]